MQKQSFRIFISAVFILSILLILGSCTSKRKSPDQTCLLFYSHESGSEGVYQFCPENERSLLIADDYVMDIAVNYKDNAIIYAIQDQSAKINIVQTYSDSVKIESLYECGESVCEHVNTHPTDDVIIFSILDENPRLLHFNYSSNIETVIEYGVASFADISPDGKYLRYFLQDKTVLRIFDLDNMQLYNSIKADGDLIGGWSHNSQAFLIGERDVNNQFSKNVLKEVTITDKQEEILFEVSAEYDFSQTLYQTENTFIVLAHPGLKTNTRQIFEIDRNGQIISQITNKPVYNHSSLQWNNKTHQLAFQRYDVTSSRSVPEIWVWDQKTDSFTLVAENASRPIWLTR